MASKQRLKKEIDYIVSDLVTDCSTFINLHQGKANDEVFQIILGALNLRSELRALANHPENKGEGQSTKNYYDNIARTLVGYVESSYVKMEELINQN